MSAYTLGFFVGACLGSYLFLRLFMFILSKIRRGPTNHFLRISAMGALCLGFSTIVGGYGFQNGASAPLFLDAFRTYFMPVVIVTGIELFREWRRGKDPFVKTRR